MRNMVEGLNPELKPIEKEVPMLEKNLMLEDLITEAEEYSLPEEKEGPEPEIKLAQRTKPSDLVEEKTQYLEKARERGQRGKRKQRNKPWRKFSVPVARE